MINYSVIEGSHKNPNEMKTVDNKTKKEYGPFKKKVVIANLGDQYVQKIIACLSLRFPIGYP